MWEKIRPYFTRDRFARALLGQFQVPGWLFIILAIVIGVPDWTSRYQFWLGVAKSTPGKMSTIATILLWPYFPIVLAVVGLAFLFIGWNQKYPAQRHPIVPVVGWISFAVCFLAVLLTAGFGWHEITLREAYDQGRAGAPRGTPDDTGPQRTQVPLYAGGDLYGVTPDQARIFLQEFPKLKPLIKVVIFSRAPSDQNAYAYWLRLHDLLTRSGIPSDLRDQLPRGPEEEGLMIEVRDTKQVPLSAQRIREAFEIANIHLNIIEMPPNFVPPDVDFVIFIGPQPIRWN
jgi:hypothetical protein